MVIKFKMDYVNPINNPTTNNSATEIPICVPASFLTRDKLFKQDQVYFKDQQRLSKVILAIYEIIHENQVCPSVEEWLEELLPTSREIPSLSHQFKDPQRILDIVAAQIKRNINLYTKVNTVQCNKHSSCCSLKLIHTAQNAYRADSKGSLHFMYSYQNVYKLSEVQLQLCKPQIADKDIPLVSYSIVEDYLYEVLNMDHKPDLQDQIKPVCETIPISVEWYSTTSFVSQTFKDLRLCWVLTSTQVNSKKIQIIRVDSRYFKDNHIVRVVPNTPLFKIDYDNTINNPTTNNSATEIPICVPASFLTRDKLFKQDQVYFKDQQRLSKVILAIYEIIHENQVCPSVEEWLEELLPTSREIPSLSHQFKDPQRILDIVAAQIKRNINLYTKVNTVQCNKHSSCCSLKLIHTAQNAYRADSKGSLHFMYSYQNVYKLSEVQLQLCKPQIADKDIPLVSYSIVEDYLYEVLNMDHKPDLQDQIKPVCETIPISVEWYSTTSFVSQTFKDLRLCWVLTSTQVNSKKIQIIRVDSRYFKDNHIVRVVPNTPLKQKKYDNFLPALRRIDGKQFRMSHKKKNPDECPCTTLEPSIVKNSKKLYKPAGIDEAKKDFTANLTLLGCYNKHEKIMVMCCSKLSIVSYDIER